MQGREEGSWRAPGAAEAGTWPKQLPLLGPLGGPIRPRSRAVFLLDVLGCLSLPSSWGSAPQPLPGSSLHPGGGGPQGPCP